MTFGNQFFLLLYLQLQVIRFNFLICSKMEKPRNKVRLPLGAGKGQVLSGVGVAREAGARPRMEVGLSRAIACAV